MNASLTKIKLICFDWWKLFISSFAEVALKVSAWFKSLLAGSTTRRTFLVFSSNSMISRVNMIEEGFGSVSANFKNFQKLFISRRNLFLVLELLFGNFVCHHCSFFHSQTLEFLFGEVEGSRRKTQKFGNSGLQFRGGSETSKNTSWFFQYVFTVSSTGIPSATPTSVVPEFFTILPNADTKKTCNGDRQ